MDTQFIAHLENGALVWIGAVRTSLQEPWKWITGEPFQYKHFVPNEGSDADRVGLADGITVEGAHGWSAHLQTPAAVEYSRHRNIGAGRCVGIIVEWDDDGEGMAAASATARAAVPPAPANNTSPAYPQPPKWTDATANLRKENLGKGLLVADGEWLKAARDMTFYLTPSAQIRNPIVRVLFSDRVGVSLRRARVPLESFYSGDMRRESLGIGLTTSTQLRLVQKAATTRLDGEHEAVFAAHGSSLTLWLDGREVATTQNQALESGGIAIFMSKDDPAGDCRLKSGIRRTAGCPAGEVMHAPPWFPQATAAFPPRTARSSFGRLTDSLPIILFGYMHATTIKLDANLHSAIRRLKPREQTLTAYVRELVAREEKCASLESAADAYAALLAANKNEAEWLAGWEAAPLAEAPKRRSK